jgi:hypothetical protein
LRHDPTSTNLTVHIVKKEKAGFHIMGLIEQCQTLFGTSDLYAVGIDFCGTLPLFSGNRVPLVDQVERGKVSSFSFLGGRFALREPTHTNNCAVRFCCAMPQVLGVTKDASVGQLKKGYDKKALKACDCRAASASPCFCPCSTSPSRFPSFHLCRGVRVRMSAGE